MSASGGTFKDTDNVIIIDTIMTIVVVLIIISSYLSLPFLPRVNTHTHTHSTIVMIFKSDKDNNSTELDKVMSTRQSVTPTQCNHTEDFSQTVASRLGD